MTTHPHKRVKNLVTEIDEKFCQFQEEYGYSPNTLLINSQMVKDLKLFHSLFIGFTFNLYRGMLLMVVPILDSAEVALIPSKSYDNKELERHIHLKVKAIKDIKIL